MRTTSAILCGIFAAPAAAATFPTLPGGDLDLSILGSQVIQTVQTGSTPLVVGKSTMIRVGVGATGTIPGGATVDGVLRVFVDGSEASWSPVYSANGPVDVLATPSLLNADDTLNFVFIAPDSSDVDFSIEVNPAGPTQLFETDFGNNTLSIDDVPFTCADTPDIVWVPIDYRPSGGPTPNLPDPLLIEPGVGDNFIQGIHPSADNEYRRSDFPSKLWTSSLSGTGSALNSSLASDLNQMNPQPDFIYGWVPGGLPYNGQAIGIPGVAAMGNTQPTRHQRTFAHELGHLFGLSHNSTDIATIGMDVEHHLAITQSLPQVKFGLKDIMAPGLLTNQAWIWPGNYIYYKNHFVFNCNEPLLAASDQDSLMVTGVWNRETQTIDLGGTVAIQKAKPSATVAPEHGDLVLRAWSNDRVVYEAGIVAEGAPDCAKCDGSSDSEGDVPPDAGFSIVLPSTVVPSSIELFEIIDPRTGNAPTVLAQSPHAPELTLLSPRPNELLGDSVLVEWEAFDADGDDLTYYVRYSPDGERRVPIASNVAETSVLVEMTSMPSLDTGKGFFEVLATDGLNTTRVATQNVRNGYLGVGGNAPWVHMLTPDAGKSYPFGGTVILHSSGWDLEDLSLGGASIVWTSDLDGQIATGRVTSVSDLSVGTHVLTVTGTDSGGLQTSDSATITITDRVLPGGVTCQTDLGFGGPGSAVLEVCGGDLSTGTTADVALSGAAPSTPLWLAIGATNAPTPLLGGTVVPVPTLVLLEGLTDGTGSWTLGPLFGGGGPATLYGQVVYIDLGQTEGFGLSNAVQLDFLP